MIKKWKLLVRDHCKYSYKINNFFCSLDDKELFGSDSESDEEKPVGTEEKPAKTGAQAIFSSDEDDDNTQNGCAIQ